ncbi:RNA-binding, CRM domain [Dillenia turbinata]|uniref:RNA-binding, CRM domain n=1 Tax=Dillenia turbinata TaxID=194707 RepID=A0AAN8WBE5_9MAGN
MSTPPSTSIAYPCSYSHGFVVFIPKKLYSISLRTPNYRLFCSHQTVQLDTQISIKKKRKPRPSFHDQIREKWSMKIGSKRETLPWQKQTRSLQQKKEEEEEETKEEEEEEEKGSGVAGSTGGDRGNTSSVGNLVSFGLRNRFVSAPWVHGSKTQKSHVEFLSDKGFDFDDNVEKSKSFDQYNVKSPKPLNVEKDKKYEVKPSKSELESVFGESEQTYKFDLNVEKKKNVDVEHSHDYELEVKTQNPQLEFLSGKSERGSEFDVNVEKDKNMDVEVSDNGEFEVEHSMHGNPVGIIGENKVEVVEDDNDVDLLDYDWPEVDEDYDQFEGSSNNSELPWERARNSESVGGGKWRRTNTIVAEKTIPQHELHRLRKISLRMVERTKVGKQGITRALVDLIHEKWKVDEVVKLKFDGPLACQMRRTHAILERKTGGLVIWRCGSSVVLYRGMSYNLPCVQSYHKQSQDGQIRSSTSIADETTKEIGGKEPAIAIAYEIPDHAKYLKDLPEEDLMDLSDLHELLDELGPRYEDWSGPHPLPVDADLLPPIVPGYKRPFRLFPHGIRHCLKDKEMTFFRRFARKMHPHFALGRNRDLQGLAVAMVKLWEKSAIAKIAIKRGILTGGTLLSRNKEYIVFYRGNDFLPPGVTAVLMERQKVTELQQDEEEFARKGALSFSNFSAKHSQGPLVAGTLAETVAATSQWKIERGSKEIERMMKESAYDRHASIVRNLEMKLMIAKEKFAKAGKALSKIQGFSEPAGLPTDLETISDEERFLFRKMGLSMKPFLNLGRRGVFDGTIENMHLHWKFRELVKIIVKGKNFAQVKHLAIALEAESGGVLVSVDKTTKGYAIIVYRGKNYQRPLALKPKNLLTKRRALARSIELQRREALKHHMLDLEERIEILKSELDEMKTIKEVDDATLSSRMKHAYSSDDDTIEDEEEAQLVLLSSIPLC